MARDIDINGDMGERDGRWTPGHDEGVRPLREWFGRD